MCISAPKMPKMTPPPAPLPPPPPRSETAASQGAGMAKQKGVQAAARRRGTRGMKTAGLQIYS